MHGGVEDAALTRPDAEGEAAVAGRATMGTPRALPRTADASSCGASVGGASPPVRGDRTPEIGGGVA
jgi:hypothetical protein